MRLLTLLLFILVIALGTLFAVLNAEPVLFDYYLGQSEIPLSLLLVVALAVGVLVGVLSALPQLISLRLRLHKSEKAELP